jgi:hypothetical protein
MSPTVSGVQGLLKSTEANVFRDVTSMWQVGCMVPGAVPSVPLTRYGHSAATYIRSFSDAMLSHKCFLQCSVLRQESSFLFLSVSAALMHLTYLMLLHCTTKGYNRVTCGLCDNPALRNTGMFAGEISTMMTPFQFCRQQSCGELLQIWSTKRTMDNHTSCCARGFVSQLPKRPFKVHTRQVPRSTVLCVFIVQRTAANRSHDVRPYFYHQLPS